MAEAARLRAYGERVAALRAVPPQAVHNLRRYGGRAHGLIAADAKARWAALEREAAFVRLRDGFAPSLYHLADLSLYDETRFSLMLAGLLDPVRGGPVAHALWPALFSRLQARAEGERRRRLGAALAHWSADLVDRLCVDPVRHGVEWDYLDIFARVVDEEYRFGVVIENKVRATTGEQHRQLARYHGLITNQFPSGAERTVFVFLTEAPREMVSAEHTVDCWQPLLWADVADCLGQIASGLPLGWALLAQSARDAIFAEILGRRTAEELRRSLASLSRHAVSATSDADWSSLHSMIVNAHANLGELK